MYEVKLSWENGNKEVKQFEDYNETLGYLVDNPEAGFMVWEDGVQMNEIDICRDFELVS